MTLLPSVWLYRYFISSSKSSLNKASFRPDDYWLWQEDADLNSAATGFHPFCLGIALSLQPPSESEALLSFRQLTMMSICPPSWVNELSRRIPQTPRCQDAQKKSEDIGYNLHYLSNDSNYSYFALLWCRRFPSSPTSQKQRSTTNLAFYSSADCQSTDFGPQYLSDANITLKGASICDPRIPKVTTLRPTLDGFF